MTMPIYIDYASTTPVDPRVARAMARHLGADGIFGNPASRTHAFGEQAAQAVEHARQQVADLIAAEPREIVWTSGATEADNLAIKGAAYQHARRGRHIVTSAIEHRAVLDTCQHLESEGFEVTYINPEPSGVISPAAVENALRDNTTIISLMHVNNELGTITDIAAIGRIARSRGILFHVDAAQSTARLPINVQDMPVDLLSLSAHKMYGPKGIGALYVRRRAPRAAIQPQVHGGGHEGGLRAGTLPTHQIVGMGEAAHILQRGFTAEQQHLAQLTDQLLDMLQALPGVRIHGDRRHCAPGIINASFEGAESEALMLAMDGIALSAGSACTSADIEPSHVLAAIGVPDDEARASLRFSFGRYTTADQIAHLGQRLAAALQDMRALGAREAVAHAA